MRLRRRRRGRGFAVVDLILKSIIMPIDPHIYIGRIDGWMDGWEGLLYAYEQKMFNV